MKNRIKALSVIALAAVAGFTFVLRSQYVLTSQELALGDFRFHHTQDENSVIVTKHTGNAAHVNIPAALAGMPVVELRFTFLLYDTPSGAWAPGASLAKNTRLRSVALPETLTVIGRDAFRWCAGLTGVSIPSGVTRIDREAFAFCAGLTSVNLAGVSSIGYSAFAGCSGLTSLNLAGVASIDACAFDRCTGLTSVNLTGVRYIGSGAFMGCTGLTSVTIPESVAEPGKNVFDGCANLTSVTFVQASVPFGSFDEFTSVLFPGDLGAKRLAGGPGTYTRARGGEVWTKQIL